MALLEYIKNRWYVFGIIIFVIGAGMFIFSENKKQEKYDNCNCGEVMYSKTDYDLHLKDNYVTFKCTFCKKEHNHEVSKKRDYLHPTCTKEGYEKFTYTCNDVSWFFYEENTNLGFAEHNYVLHNPGVKPTCLESGISDFEICTECNSSRGGEELEPLGHSLITIDEVKPTCTNIGYTHYVICENCDYVESYGEEIEPLGHDLQLSIVEPTYSTDGYSEYGCSRCEYSYQEDYTACLFSDYCVYHVDSYGNVYLDGLKSDTIELIIPETINANPVVGINEYFTWNYQTSDYISYVNTSLKKVVMPDSIKELGHTAFYNCLELEEVVLSNNITLLAHNTFKNCSKLN